MPPPPPLTDALLREADALLLGLLRNDLIGVYVLQDLQIRYANRRFAEMFGYTPETLLRHPEVERFICPKDRERVLDTVARRIRGETDTAHYTFRGQHADGRLLELEVFGNRTQLEGRPAIIGLMLDITARKTAEQTTVEQLHFIGQLIEAIPSPVFFKDDQARYLGCNRAFETYIGRPREALIGRSVFDISPPELAARYHEADQMLFDHPGVQTYEASVESSDGLRKEVIFNKATWLKADGSVGGLVGVITDITDRKQSEALIWMQANYDPLTGLPNRRLLGDRLAEQIKRAQREQGSLAVLYIDLDRFKEVNDALGHEAGDRLLMEAARRVVGCVRGTDTVARQGGDEFTVLLPGLSERAPIERIAEDIILALTEPFTLGDEQAYVSASIGITLFPQDADNAIAILKNADQAMYHAKEEGRNRFCYFSPAMQERAMLRVQLGKDLRSALTEGQLSLHFQPIPHLGSGAIHKAEALLRWTHPQRGPVSPAEFIPVAEELGLIDAIGAWVFRHAVAAVARWRERQPGVQITVNASPRQFATGNSLEVLLDELDRHRLPGSCIAVEITEGLLLDERPTVTAQLARLSAAGIQISLDDFGTGYSAMAYLKRMDIHTLKIDRSFIRDLTTDPSDLAITEAIVAMAHKLGLQVVAEGVETDAQRQRLIAAHCDYGQGYLFARPLPEDAFLDLVAPPPA
ncbi:putative bifunctional diguanylate cyclase/phosphodiesterase [Zoogloea sp.]|uniref:putative bifunctional diguanylate cyclase/phosphodiesterase n=1 Tax=Zoogloea sp. TaxID=49181 RepID=UPI0035B0C3B8